MSFLHISDRVLLNLRNVSHIEQHRKSIRVVMNYTTSLFIGFMGGSDPHTLTLDYKDEAEAKKYFEEYRKILVLPSSKSIY